MTMTREEAIKPTREQALRMLKEHKYGFVEDSTTRARLENIIDALESAAPVAGVKWERFLDSSLVRKKSGKFLFNARSGEDADVAVAAHNATVSEPAWQPDVAQALDIAESALKTLFSPEVKEYFRRVIAALSPPAPRTAEEIAVGALKAIANADATVDEVYMIKKAKAALAEIKQKEQK